MSPINPLVRVISGGQAGVDRGALDAAIELNFPYGGFCPKGRRAEDGVIPATYKLAETKVSAYPYRTELNITSSDATLILYREDGIEESGTALTYKLCCKHHKPVFQLNFDWCTDEDLLAEAVRVVMGEWLIGFEEYTLNVAGPRESKFPGIQAQTKAFVMRMLTWKRESAYPSQPTAGTPQTPLDGDPQL